MYYQTAVVWYTDIVQKITTLKGYLRKNERPKWRVANELFMDTCPAEIECSVICSSMAMVLHCEVYQQ